jgi:hypothetical protein
LLTIVPNLAPSELVRAPPAIASAAGFRRALRGTSTGPGASTVLIAPVSDGQLAMYAQVQASFAYRIPDGGVFVPSPQGASYGMRHGPLLYALAVLGDRPSTLAGRTATDALGLAQLARATTLSDACRAHYLHALRLLGVEAVIATDLGSPVERERDRWFFESLLGAGRETGGAAVYNVPVA